MNNNLKNKIGILGGTFNPLHIGHLTIAQNALEYCGLDKVLIMPSGVSYFKDQKKILSAEHRINIAKLSTEDNPNFNVSTMETERTGNSYTYETLEILSNDKTNEYYYICGADTLYNIEYWKNPHIIFEKSVIVCAKRNNVEPEKLQKKADELTEKFNGKIIIMDCPEVNISSSEIRKMLSEGMSCRYYIHDKAIQYIKTKELYKNQ